MSIRHLLWTLPILALCACSSPQIQGLYWLGFPLVDADGSPRLLNYSAILAPDAYGLEIETETGHGFRGSFTVPSNTEPDDAGELAPIPVVVSPVRR